MLFRSIRDNEELPLDLKSIKIPGHTEGNLSILAEKGEYRDQGVLISGDTVIELRNKLNLPYEGYCDNYEKARNNLSKLLEYDFEKILPGHGNKVFERQDLVKLINEIQ